MEDTSSDEEENRRQSEPRSSRSRRKGRHSLDHSAAPPLFSPLHYPQYAPGGAGYPGGPYVSPFYRPLALTPWSSMSSISMYSTPFSPREGQLPPPQSRIPLSRSFPLLSGEKVGGLGSSASADPHQGNHAILCLFFVSAQNLGCQCQSFGDIYICMQLGFQCVCGCVCLSVYVRFPLRKGK